MLLADWPSSLKSRSLEDILLASAAAPPPRSLGHAAGRKGQGREGREVTIREVFFYEREGSSPYHQFLYPPLVKCRNV